MTKYRIKIIAALCAIAGLGASTALANKDTSTTSSSSTYHQSAKPGSTSAQTTDANAGTSGIASGELRMASAGAEGKTLDEFQGKTVTGSDGQELGEINDFMINAQTGEIAYAVISSGGALGIGDKLRVVPHSSLQPSASAEGLTVELDQAAFEAMATVDENDLDAGRVSASSSQSWDATVEQQDASTGTSASATIGATSDTAITAEPTPSPSSSDAVASTTTTQPADITGAPSVSTAAAAGDSHLIRASKLKGKELRAQDAEIGTIESIAIDLDQGTATAVVEVDDDFADSDASFHVPFSDLQVDSADTDTVSTTLARSDFTQAQSSSTATPGFATESSSSADETLTPTGRTSASVESSETSDAPQGVAGQDSTSTTAASSDEQLTPTGRGQGNWALSGASSAVEAALENDESLAAEDVRVQAAGQKIMLQGKVSSEEKKEQIETVARQAAGGAEIENKLKVKKQK